MASNKRKRRSNSDDSDNEDGSRPAPALPRLPPPYIFNPNMSISEYRQFAWLERSKNWDGLDPTEWLARKILGAGSYGLVRLWEYIGGKAKMPTHMVVKQTVPKKRYELASESKFLGLTTSTGTDHIVKLYKGYHEVEGTGVTDKRGWDGLPFNSDDQWDEEFTIARMYIEYCGGGDLSEWMKRIRKEDRRFVIPEEVLWRILFCLANALLVLDKGSEDTESNKDTNNWSKFLLMISDASISKGWKANCPYSRTTDMPF
jgi:hypothetical protein